jgi:hypothetical protein
LAAAGNREKSAGRSFMSVSGARLMRELAK